MQRYASIILSVSKRARSDDDDDVRERAEAVQRKAGGEFVRTGTSQPNKLAFMHYLLSVVS